MNLKFTLFAFLLFSQAFFVRSQDLVSCAGGHFSNSSYEVDWSIGECLTETLSGNSGIVSQGLHQGHYIITSLNESLKQSFNISVYPNPFVENFNIDFSELDNLHEIKIELYDEKGALLHEKSVIKHLEKINLTGMPGQCFFLKLISGKQLLGTHKIIKSN